MPDGNYQTADMRLNILKSMELIARMKVSGTMEIGRKYMIDLTRPLAYHHHSKPPYALTINGATTTAIIVAAISAKRKSRSRVIFMCFIHKY
ncbi:MAG: hypothetical protein WB443_04600 [Nitrososphaeraceae archaeon]